MKLRLIKISTFMIVISTILLLVLIPLLNRQISVLSGEIERLQKTNSIRDANLLSDSIQRLKMSTTYAHYYILVGLNSSKSSEFDSKLKIQMIESISGLSDGGVDKKELFKKSVNELADIMEKKAFEYVQLYNSDIENIRKLQILKENKERTRDLFIPVLGIIQSIGLLLGFMSEYHNKEIKK